MLKFLIDENVPPAIGVFLQSLDFDVVHAKDSGLLGASDKQVMDLARQKERTPSTNISLTWSSIHLVRIGESFGFASIRRCYPTSFRLLIST